MRARIPAPKYGVPMPDPIVGVYRFEVGQRLMRVLSGLTMAPCVPEDEFEGKCIERSNQYEHSWWPVYKLRDDEGTERTFGEQLLVRVAEYE